MKTIIYLLFQTMDDLEKAVAAELSNSARFRIIGPIPRRLAQENDICEAAEKTVSYGMHEADPDSPAGDSAGYPCADIKAPGSTGIVICEQELLARLAEGKPTIKAGTERNFYLTMPPESFPERKKPVITGEIAAKLDAAGVLWCVADSRKPSVILEMLWHISSLDLAYQDKTLNTVTRGSERLSPGLYSSNPVETYLKRSGFSPLLSGFTFLSEAAELAAGEEEHQGIITKIIYPAIARKHDKSSESVERAIRFAIVSAWDSGKLEGSWNWSRDNAPARPTNAEMIFRLARIAENNGSGSITA